MNNLNAILIVKNLRVPVRSAHHLAIQLYCDSLKGKFE
jgi:hypothetical protein